MVFGGVVFSSTSFLLVAVTVLIWAAFWGAMSVAVAGRSGAPRSYWLLLGVLGPLGPLCALLSVEVQKRRSGHRARG